MILTEVDVLPYQTLSDVGLIIPGVTTVPDTCMYIIYLVISQKPSQLTFSDITCVSYLISNLDRIT